jgi:hypothetical protein
MKKRIGFPAVALFLLALSCSKSTDPKPADPFANYLVEYQKISLHNTVAMDPFQVAHRLNLYLNNGNTDALQKELFPEAKVVVEPGNRYIIRYRPKTAPANDYLRQGDLIVSTGGKSLSEPGTIWQVSTDPDSLYCLNMGDYGTIGLQPEPNGYTIEARSTNSWSIRANELTLMSTYTAQTAVWNVDATVTQVQGGESSQLADDRFQTEVNRPGENGGLTFDVQRYRYETLSPVLTMNSCNLGSRSGGKERIIKMDEYGYVGKDTLEVDFGSQFVCDPSYTMSARIDSVWTTQSF